MKNQHLISELTINNWIFKKEANFRDFAIEGKSSNDNKPSFNFELMSNEQFFRLHTFITNYFDYDAIYFTKFEKELIKRSHNYRVESK